MGIDHRFVTRLLAEIETHLLILEKARLETEAQLFKDPLRALGVQHALQILIEAVLAISHQVISGLNLKRPEKNLEAPAKLFQAGVLTDLELSERLPSMVRFRNLLVHRYWEVKEELVYQILHGHLDDIRLFATQVSDFLETSDGQGSHRSPST